MPLTPRQADTVQHLVAAHRTGQPWAPPGGDADLSLADAYAVQAGVARALGWFPDGPRAWKVGGQPPTAAPLPQVVDAPAAWPAPSRRTLVVEAELAFRLARAPRPGEPLVDALGTVAVAIEIVDSRLADGLNAPAAWKLADQGVHAGLVLGSATPCADWAPWRQAAWAELPCELWRNGQRVRTARGSHPCGNPLSALPWLQDHAQAQGGDWRAGDLITTGAWIAEPAQVGDSVTVVFPGLAPATVRLLPPGDGARA